MFPDETMTDTSFSLMILFQKPLDLDAIQSPCHFGWVLPWMDVDRCHGWTWIVAMDGMMVDLFRMDNSEKLAVPVGWQSRGMLVYCKINL